MTREEYAELTKKGLVYLDGATGSNLYKAGMPKGVSTEGWVLDHPDVVEKLQKEYVEAGSQIVYAPTFGANRHTLAGYGLDGNVEDMNQRLVDLSRRAVGDRALIAGDIAPTGMILESSGGDYTVDDLFEVYREQLRILVGEGVDLIIAETMLSVDETVVALDAARDVAPDLAVTCTLSVNADGRAFYGGTAVEAVETLQALGADAVGLNCSSGPDQMESVIRNMKAVSEIPVIAKPNAGLPLIDEYGNAIYKMGPDEFAAGMKKLVEAGASVIGGCCGTTPEYIRKLHLEMEGKLIRHC